MIPLELLAPAGSLGSVRAALRYGADSVYMGGSMLQMRSASAGFTDETLYEAVKLIHEKKKRAYVTVNTVLGEDDLPALPGYIGRLRDIGPDALIVCDIGAIAVIKEVWPQAEIHLSTQANVMNSSAAKVYGSLGVKRIVLAREMTLEAVRALRQNTPADIELEAFAHGSMCMAYSGRCLLSSFLLGRSGNRGECAQPCRWEYALMEQKRPGVYFPIEEEGRRSMILSSRDLRMIAYLDELYDAGVSSVKIEGRMKTEYYVAAVTNAYRMALDGTASLEDCERELETFSHRPYTAGFYKNELPDDHFNSGLYEQNWSFAALVTDAGDGRITVQQRNKFSVGETLEALTPGKPGMPFVVTEMQNADGESIDSAPHPLMTVTLPCPLALKPGDMLRRKNSQSSCAEA